MEDIVVYSNTFKEHHKHVQEVLKRLRNACLYLKLSKYEFNTKHIRFVRFFVTPQEVEIKPDCIKLVTEWPMPESYLNIQVFLGFANFYRRFIENFLKITQLMSDLLEGGKNGKFPGPFQATPEMECAFCSLQQAFTTAPVLVHFDPDKPMWLETNLFGFAIAGILPQPVDQAVPKVPKMAPTPGKKVAQDWHPLAFWSRTMVPAERNYTVRDQERLAIIMSCRHWRHYLEGPRQPVVVLTAHHNLQRFMSTKPPDPQAGTALRNSNQLSAGHTISDQEDKPGGRAQSQA
jgi:hypothetical protein